MKVQTFYWLFLFLCLNHKYCLDSLNYTQYGAVGCARCWLGLLCGTNMHSNKMYVRVCTQCRCDCERCGIHVSLNWLKSIWNRKRCRVLHSQSFWYSRDVSVPAPHVMASHEHTYIWSPTASEPWADKELKLFDFLFFSFRNPSWVSGCQGSGFPSSQHCVVIFLI